MRRGKSERTRHMQMRQRDLPLPPVPPYWRPKTRADCIDGPRPCPYVGCRYHLLLNVSKRGGLQIIEPDPLQFGETCSLDIAARRHHALLKEISGIMGMSIERVRQIENEGMEKLRIYCEAKGLRAPHSVWNEDVDSHFVRD